MVGAKITLGSLVFLVRFHCQSFDVWVRNQVGMPILKYFKHWEQENVLNVEKKLVMSVTSECCVTQFGGIIGGWTFATIMASGQKIIQALQAKVAKISH